MEAEASVPLSQQLGLLKKPNITIALGMTFFVFIGFSVVNTFMSPFLSSVMFMSEGGISIIVFALGIASLIGSNLAVSTNSGSVIVTIPLLMLWAIAAWVFGMTQNFNLVSLAQESSGIILSLNSTFVQIGIAAGAGIGGIAAGSSSMLAISWIGAASAAIAVLIAVSSFSLTRSSQKSVATK